MLEDYSTGAENHLDNKDIADRRADVAAEIGYILADGCFHIMVVVQSPYLWHRKDQQIVLYRCVACSQDGAAVLVLFPLVGCCRMSLWKLILLLA